MDSLSILQIIICRPAGERFRFARFRSKCACISLPPGSMNVQSSVWWSASMMVNTK